MTFNAATLHSDIAALLRRVARSIRERAGAGRRHVYKEAPEVLEMPRGTLTSRLARAREALQGLLSDQARTVA